MAMHMNHMTLPQLLAQINARHSTDFRFVSALAGGHQDGAILLSDATGAQFVLKQWYKPQAIPILATLAARGYPASPPIVAGYIDDQPYWVQPYRAGTPMQVLHEHYLAQLFAITTLQAALPAHFHDPQRSWSTYAYRVVFHHESGWVTDLQAHSSATARFVDNLARWVQPWKDTPLVHTDAVHGDCTPDNMVVDGDQISGVIDTAAFDCGTRAIDLVTMLHYAYLYDYSAAVKRALLAYLGQQFPSGTIAIAIVYRMLAMLAWVLHHDPPEVVQHAMVQNHHLLSDLPF
jgi:aminoglycoside phosphotransferase (APT) family kinase protein